MITYRWPQEGGMRRRWRRWRGSWWRLRRAKKLKVGKSATKVVGRRRWTELVAARSCTGTLPPRHPAVVLSSPGTSSVSSTKLSFVIFLKTNLVGSWSKTARPLFVRFFCVLFCANFKQFWIFWDGGKTWFFFQKRSESATPDSTYVFVSGHILFFEYRTWHQRNWASEQTSLINLNFHLTIFGCTSCNWQLFIELLKLKTFECTKQIPTFACISTDIC